MTIQTRILRSLSRDDSWLNLDQRFGPDLGGEFAVARSSMVVGAAPSEGGTTERAPSGGGEIQTYLPSNPQNHTDGGTLELDGLSSIVSTDVGGFTYVFAAGGVDDGISVFRLNATGTLTPVHDVTDDATFELDGARGLSTAMVDGNTYLFVAGQADNGVSVFRVNTNGSLTNVSNVNDDATMLLTGVSDTATARVGASTYLYTAGTTENGISIFRVAGDGRLTYLSNHADAGTLELAGVRALTQVTIGATAFLIAGGTDDGISVFSINAGTGALTSTDDENDTGAINLNDVSDITTAVIGGVTYVFVAGAADNGVSVYSLSGAGVLTHIESESDSAATLAAGANSVTVSVVGGIAYLHVGSTENGTNLYLFNPAEATGRVLLHADQIADTGTLELSGTTTTATASVGGTTYLLGGGATDDGLSAFGSSTTGQLWYSTEGNLTDARIAFVNTDGFNHVSFIDNNPATQLTTAFIESIALDTAAGLYYILVGGNEGINSRILMGHIGSTAAPTVVFTFDPTYAGSENNLAFGLEIDTINERLYVGYIEFNPTFGPTTQGIRQFNYNTTTGAVTGGTFFVTENSTPGGVPPSAAGADGLFASRDLDIDTTNNVVYSHQLALGNGFETNNILRFSLSAPGAGTAVLNQALFSLDGDGSDFTTVNGIIADIEVDEASNRLYFLTRAEDVNEAGTEDSIWMVANASTASNATPTKLTLVGVTLSDFYPTDMIMDEVNNILYIESENSNLVGGGTTDVILVFQLNAAGTIATLINTIDMRFTTTANVEGLHFNYLADLGALTATGTAAVEQGAAVDLLSVAPAISDFDGDHLASATVQITGGSFNSNENSFNDDDLGHSASMTQSGLIAGTNITISWNQATGTLTLTGYDTFANYQAALNAIHFQSTGDNPTNYGLNPSRTITWTISDGSPGIPTGSENSGTTTINITAVNDGPTNTVPVAQVIAEDSVLNLAGVSIADPDLNPAITDIVVTLTATNGTITLLTNVAGGLTAADIANNGTGTVTITATRNEINATFAAVGGLAFLNTPDYNGPASVQIVTNDGGNTGTGGPLSDTDVINITVNAVVDIANDAPTFAEDSGVQNLDLLANDTFENSGRFISAVTQGAHGTVTINNNGTAGDLTDDFVVYTQVADYNGADSFTYTVTSGGVTEVATVNVTITAVADIVNDVLNFAEDAGAQSINVLANDTFENPARFISAVTQGVHGTVTINNNGTAGDLTDDFIVYTQVADYNGTDSFTYTVTSGGVTEIGTVNVTISAVADIADDNVTVNEDSGANALNGIGNPVSLLANDSFENAGRFISAVTQGVHGSVAINNNGTAGDATDDYVVYTVTDPNYNGPDSFTYTVTSGGVTEVATVNVTIAAVNDAPVNTVPGTQTINEDATLTFTGANAISIADIDAGAADLTTTITIADGALTVGAVMAGLTVGGEGTNTLTLTGTLAEINDALDGLTYAPPAHANGSRTLTITTNDNGNTGSPGALQDVDMVTINITAQNDTPVVAVAASVSSTEQVAGTIDAAATITDVELGALNNYAGSTLTVGRNGGPAAEDLLTFGASGAFTVNGSNLEAGGLVFATFTGGNGTALVITFTGSGTPATQALVDAVVQSLQYTYTGDTPPASIVMDYTFNDGAPANAGQGGGGSPTGTDAITINITDTPENSPPTLDLDGDDSNTVGTGYTASFTEGGAAVLITDSDVAIADVDAGDMIEGATITINSPLAGDQLVLGAQGGFVVTGSGTGTITITGAGTAAQYEAMLEQITFSSATDDPGATRTINITVTDGTDTSNIAVSTINIAEINDEPTLAATAVNPTFTEGGAAVDLFSGVTADTIEAGQTFVSLTLTVTNVTDGADEILVVDGMNVALTNGNVVATGAGNVTVTLAAGVATVVVGPSTLSEAGLQTLIDGLAYLNTSENPTDADRVVTITQLVDSGSDTSPNDATLAPGIASTVNVNPVNDAPINTVPGTQTINEDASVTLSTGNGNAIQVADADATTLTVTLTVLHGTLTLASTAGLSFGTGDGTADATMTFSGTAAAINAALGSGLTYNPNADFNGSDSIAVSTTDNGQSGGPAQTDNDSVTINITAINDAPVVIGDGTESATTINEDTPGAGQTIQVLFAGQYSDAADNQIPNGGASSPGQFSGVAVTANGSSPATGQWQYFSGGVWTDIGAVSDAAAKLFGDPFVTLFRFNPAPDFNGPAPTLTVHLIDNSLPFGIVNGQVVDLSGPGATGGTTAYSTGTVVLSQDVTAVNDAPLNTVPGAQVINEDASFTLSTGNGNAIQVADADATTLTVTLTVLNGTLTLASTAGLSFGTGDGTADLTMTFSGTAAAINAALGSGLTYNPTANYNGPDSIAVLTTDNGQTGTGGTLQDNDSIAITVNSVNDAPSGADNTVTGSEDDPLVLTAADFGFTDPIDGNAFLAVIIDTFPANGTLFLDSDGPGGAAPVDLSTLGPGVFVGINDINLGHLYFQPDPDEFGNGYAQFTFRVQDDGGMLNGGVDRDPIANTITINITPDNLPPEVDLNGAGAGINDAVSYTEDAPGIAIGSAITVTDPNSGVGDMIESATITLTDRVAGDTLAIAGALPAGISSNITVNAGTIVVTLSGTASQADYATAIGQIRYSTTNQDPTLGGTDATRTITVVVNDGTVDSAVATSTVTITPLDDAPVAQPDAFITNENAVLSSSVFPDNGSGADADPDGPPLQVGAVNGMAVVGSQITLASGALLTVNADGTFSYDPNGAFDDLPDFVTSGASNTTDTDSFTYTLVGGNTVTVTLTIRGVDSDGDILLGTPGVDSLNGGIGADTMTGFAGNDTFFVDNAGDVIVEAVGGGDDTVRSSVSYALGAGVSVETLTTTNQAGVGAINLTGNEFDNRIEGNDGANILAGNGGIDRLFGFGGDDTLIGGAGNDQLDGGAGIDTASFNGILNFIDTPVNWIAISVDGNDVLQNVEIAVEGSGRRNLLVGSTGFGGIQAALDAALAGDAVRLAAGVYTGTWNYSDAGLTVLAQPNARINGSFLTAGTDGITVVGANLADNITTGAGNDVISGGSGADTMAGGAGDDRYIVDNAGDVVTEAVGGGNDTLAASVSYALAAGSEVELLTTGSIAGTGAIDLTGNELANQIWGNSGANTLSGGVGADILIGFGGDDQLIGGIGGDTMLGGLGNDTYYVDDLGDSLFEMVGEGADQVVALIDYTLTMGSEIELLTTGGVGNTNAINLGGNEFGQQIWGNNGANVIDGGAGTDVLLGFGGADAFKFSTALGASNVDAIVDYSLADDSIQLDDAVFTALGLGALDPNAFVVGTAALDADDRIIYDSATGNLFYDADGVGGAAAVQFAVVIGQPALTASEFTVI